MVWTVTRQMQWPEGSLVVEISEGGIDYANPDAFCAKYAGEWEEIVDPREAVETAIEMAQQWQKSVLDDEVFIAMGATCGLTMPFMGASLEEETFKDLRERAKEFYKKLPKCARCGELLGKERYTHELEDEDKFCSEYCVEEAFQDCQKEMFDSDEE
jgi:hypothetical protein